MIRLKSALKGRRGILLGFKYIKNAYEVVSRIKNLVGIQSLNRKSRSESEFKDLVLRKRENSYYI